MYAAIALVHTKMVVIQRMLRDQKIWSQRLIRAHLISFSGDDNP